TMNHFERRYLQFAPETETRARRNDIRNHFRQAAAEVRWLEDIFEDASDIHPGAFVGVDTQCSETEVQRPDVVETKNVIGVTMSNENGVEMFQAEAQRLLSKIGGRIHE